MYILKNSDNCLRTRVYRERLQSLLSSLGPAGSEAPAPPPEPAGAPPSPAKRGVKAAAGGVRRPVAKETRAPTTSSVSELFGYGDRVKAELQRKSALGDDSYPTVYVVH